MQELRFNTLARKEEEENIGPKKKEQKTLARERGKMKRLARPEKKQKKTLARKVNIMIPSSMSTATLCSQLSP